MPVPPFADGSSSFPFPLSLHYEVLRWLSVCSRVNSQVTKEEGLAGGGSALQPDRVRGCRWGTSLPWRWSERAAFLCFSALPAAHTSIHHLPGGSCFHLLALIGKDWKQRKKNTGALSGCSRFWNRIYSRETRRRRNNAEAINSCETYVRICSALWIKNTRSTYFHISLLFSNQ